jgi:hypothetical protein
MCTPAQFVWVRLPTIHRKVRAASLDYLVGPLL